MKIVKKKILITVAFCIVVCVLPSFSYNKAKILTQPGEVSEFWQILAATYNTNRDNSIISDVVDFYLYEMFNSATTPQQINELMLFSKYSATAGEWFVDYWLILIKKNPKLFEKGLYMCHKDQLVFFNDFIKAFPAYEKRKVAKMIDRALDERE